MQIHFADKKLERIFNKEKLLRKKFGNDMAKKIMTRYYDIDAADTLDDLYQIPQARCHELKGNKQGELALT